MNINEALENLCCQGGSWSGSGAFDKEIQCVIEEVITLRSKSFNLRNCHNCYKDIDKACVNPCLTCIRSDEDYEPSMTDNWEGQISE
jgi:hypothetical protein